MTRVRALSSLKCAVQLCWTAIVLLVLGLPAVSSSAEEFPGQQTLERLRAVRFCSGWQAGPRRRAKARGVGASLGVAWRVLRPPARARHRVAGQGFHIVYMQVPNMLGCPQAVRHWNAFYRELTEKYGFARKAALVGLSRGGLYCYNWAAANPEKVACIYGDAPVCDFKSWPGGKGKGRGVRKTGNSCSNVRLPQRGRSAGVRQEPGRQSRAAGPGSRSSAARVRRCG